MSGRSFNNVIEERVMKRGFGKLFARIVTFLAFFGAANAALAGVYASNFSNAGTGGLPGGYSISNS